MLYTVLLWSLWDWGFWDILETFITFWHLIKITGTWPEISQHCSKQNTCNKKEIKNVQSSELLEQSGNACHDLAVV